MAANFLAVVMKSRSVDITIDGETYNIEELTDATFGDSPADINKGTTLKGAGYAAAGFSTPPEITLEALVNPGLAWVAALQRAKDGGKLVEVSARTPAKLIYAPASGASTIASVQATAKTGTVANPQDGTPPSLVQLARGAGLTTGAAGSRTLVGVIEKAPATGTGQLTFADNAFVAVASATAFNLVIPGYKIPDLVCEIVDVNLNQTEGDGAAAIQMGTITLQPLTSIPRAKPNVLDVDGVGL